ncbi:hypothetical protein CVO77_04100 [Sphingopyxis lindanitolerans]|uniref:Short-chain dehydrogenase n=2 Tax=Sphingopyxis lindanitolerans TaxID=2054227 RepID=A0A2S8B5U5_9SPHN|nr:hypothetical protein CVO77_04100 [Sphingopyxis lindanitolerans]
MMARLAGKVAVVTGGTKGMGRHFVDALIMEGARVAVLARASPQAQALAREYRDDVLVLDCDVTESDTVDRAVAEVAAHFGGVDILVNNAAIFEPFLLERATDDQVMRHIAVNILGPIWCTRACIPHLRVARGQVVTVSSESVRMPFPFLTVYAATKAAVETLSRGLRDELRADGIRVAVLRSGSVASGPGDRNWDPDVTAAFFDTISKSGHAAFAGEAADPRTMAQALIAMLALPADVTLDLVEARATRSTA